MTQTAQRTMLVVLPVYNDWEPLNQLLDVIDAVLAGLDMKAMVLVIDDASTDRPDPAKFRRRFVSLTEIHLLSLRRNLGHQRAIAVGLAFAQENLQQDLVLVMDADGQDAPQDFSKLLMRFEASSGQAMVFAYRKRRSEGLGFRFFYWVYRILHRLLTGHASRVGNFSLMSGAMLRRLVVLPELWNHYAAAVRKARLPVETVPLKRGKRISGKTKMSFRTLVSHGLGAMATFNENVAVRTLTISIVLTLLSLIATAGLAYYHFAYNSLRYDAWLFAVLIALATFVVTTAVLTVFLMLTLAQRTASSFLPIRDYRFYYDSVQRMDS
jgi:glycosyltransferase involved in cell wall biosynthesis